MKSLFLSSLNYEDQNTALNTQNSHEDTVIGGIMYVPYPIPINANERNSHHRKPQNNNQYRSEPECFAYHVFAQFSPPRAS